MRLPLRIILSVLVLLPMLVVQAEAQAPLLFTHSENVLPQDAGSPSGISVFNPTEDTFEQVLTTEGLAVGTTFDRNGNLYFGELFDSPVRIFLRKRLPNGIIVDLGSVLDTTGGAVEAFTWGFDLIFGKADEIHYLLPPILPRGDREASNGQLVRMNVRTNEKTILYETSNLLSGIAIDSEQNLYVGLIRNGPLRINVLRITAEGEVEDLARVFDSAGGVVSVGQYSLDLTLGSNNDLYLTLPKFTSTGSLPSAPNAVARLDLSTRELEPIATSSGAIAGLAKDASGQVFFGSTSETNSGSLALNIFKLLPTELGSALDLGQVFLSTGPVNTSTFTNFDFLIQPSGATDFDGNSNDDPAIWRPDSGDWAVSAQSGSQLRLAQSAVSFVQWGLPGDQPIAGEYDGDSKADYVTWRPSSGNWYICGSAVGHNCAQGVAKQFGLPGDVPLAGDFDGDGIFDVAVWRPNSGVWYYQSSLSGELVTQQWGLPTDLAVNEDYDGDGRSDFAIYRPESGMWAIRFSTPVENDDESASVLWKQWGLPEDHPMPGDYDGDGVADLAVWRPTNGNWYICSSTTNFDCSSATVTQFGLPEDRPVRGEFDGDGILDLAVFRPNNGNWLYKGSTNDTTQAVQWGLPNDYPIGMGIKNRTATLRLE